TGAGIAEIERNSWLREAGHADTLDDPGEITPPLDARTERAHRFGGIEHVLALEQPGNSGFADRERAQDQGPVRNGLVAGNTHLAAQRATGAGFDWGGVVRLGQHCGGRYHREGAASRPVFSLAQGAY